jgi:hypothetical protein
MLVNLLLAFVLFIIIIFFIRKYEVFTNDSFDIASLSLITLFLISDLYRFDIFGSIGWMTLIGLMIVLKNSSVSAMRIFFNTYIVVISGIGVYVLFYMLLILSGVKSSLDLPSMPFNDVMLHYDSFKEVFGVKLPRFVGHLQQVSLIPAYFIFPLGISLMFFDIRWRYFIIIIIFSLLSFSGSVYYLLFSSILAYIFYSFIRKFKFIIPGSILVLFLILAYSVALYNDFAISPGWNYDDNFVIRGSSGMSRLAIMGRGIHEFLESPLLGFVKDNDNINLYLLGSLVHSSAVRVGMLGLFFIISMYYLVIVRLLRFKVASFKEKVGVSIVYSSLIMMMSFQDYGFSSIQGYFMIFMLVRLLNNRVNI